MKFNNREDIIQITPPACPATWSWTLTGVVFIPPHLAEAVVDHSRRTHLREIFTHQRLREGVYNSSQMDTKWAEEIVADFEEWLKTHAPEDQDIDWSKPEKGGTSGDEETLLG